jgi:hypothetical protein
MDRIRKNVEFQTKTFSEFSLLVPDDENFAYSEETKEEMDAAVQRFFFRLTLQPAHRWSDDLSVEFGYWLSADLITDLTQVLDLLLIDTKRLYIEANKRQIAEFPMSKFEELREEIDALTKPFRKELNDEF